GAALLADLDPGDPLRVVLRGVLLHEGRPVDAVRTPVQHQRAAPQVGQQVRRDGPVVVGQVALGVLRGAPPAGEEHLVRPADPHAAAAGPDRARRAPALAHGTIASSTSSRPAAAIDPASMPAARNCSSGDADPGMSRTASRTRRGTGRPAAKASATAAPSPPAAGPGPDRAPRAPALAPGPSASSPGSRPAAAIAPASMPAARNCSSGDADPGMSRTASRTRRGTGRPSAKASATASPSPPSG